MNQETNIGIVELSKDDVYLTEITSRFSASYYYDVSVRHADGSWRMELTRKPFEKPMEAIYHGRLFEDHVVESRVFAAVLNGKQVGWIELGYDKWNNRMRVWEFLVEEEFRRRGIGTLLMKQAVKIAKEKNARMIVLETQTNKDAAIEFYLHSGFKLIGLDIAAYSNQDIEKKEVRLELGLALY